MTTITILRINNLELNLNLGWRSKERSEEQAVLLNMIIRFPKPPQACITDNLDDTTCYAKLIETIRHQISPKNYRLLEHLSAEIYDIAKKYFPHDSKITVSLTKYPRIGGLRDGVTFDYGDE